MDNKDLGRVPQAEPGCEPTASASQAAVFAESHPIAQEDDGPCENDDHCCCCGPGDPCCGCGHIMPDREELPALRRALSQLLEACRIADVNEDLSLHVDGSLLDEAAEALDLQYPIIWTAAQVALLEQRQANGVFHPYTCGGERGDEAHRAQAEEDGTDAGVLIPTRRGWICSVCDYRQFWSHETGGPPRDSDGPRMAETNEDSARGEAGPARAEGIAQMDQQP